MKKYFPTVMTIFVLVLGMLWCVPNIKLEASQWINIEFVVMFAICAIFIRNIWLKLFLLVSIAQDYTILSLRTWNTIHTVVLCSIFYQIVADYRPKKEAILNAICVIALINTALVFMQKAGYWVFFQPAEFKSLQLATVYFPHFIFPVCKYVQAAAGNGMAPGFFGNIDVTSAFYASVIPLFFRDGWIFLSPLPIAGLFACGALGGLAAVCLTVLVLITMYMRSWLLRAVLCVAVLLATFISCTNDWHYIFVRGAERIPTWIAYIKLMPGHLVFGHGLGKIVTFFPDLKPALGDNYLHPHNEFVSIFVETGFTGLFLICGFLFSILRKSNGVIFAGLVASVAASLTIFNMHTAVGLVPLVYAAISEGEER